MSGKTLEIAENGNKFFSCTGKSKNKKIKLGWTWEGFEEVVTNIKVNKDYQFLSKVNISNTARLKDFYRTYFLYCF